MLTISVLASPGTPSSRQCPRVKMAAKSCSITSCLADDHLLQLLLHELAVLGEFLQDIAQGFGFGGAVAVMGQAVGQGQSGDSAGKSFSGCTRRAGGAIDL